jgi:hypothetical protein
MKFLFHYKLFLVSECVIGNLVFLCTCVNTIKNDAFIKIVHSKLKTEPTYVPNFDRQDKKGTESLGRHLGVMSRFWASRLSVSVCLWTEEARRCCDANVDASSAGPTTLVIRACVRATVGFNVMQCYDHYLCTFLTDFRRKNGDFLISQCYVGIA